MKLARSGETYEKIILILLFNLINVDQEKYINYILLYDLVQY